MLYIIFLYTHYIYFNTIIIIREDFNNIILIEFNNILLIKYIQNFLINSLLSRNINFNLIFFIKNIILLI